MKRLIFSTIGMIICAFLTYSSAQTLDVYYKNEKAYEDAKINGLYKEKHKNGKYGFVNTKGKFIIKPVFDEVSEFKNELSLIQYNNKWGIIDIRGNVIINPEYTLKPKLVKYHNKSDVAQYILFNNLAVIFCEDKKNIIINIKQAIQKEYNNSFYIQEDYNNLFITEVLANEKFLYGETYYINHQGQLLKFDSLATIQNLNITRNTNLFIYKQDSYLGAIDLKLGETLTPTNKYKDFTKQKYGIILSGHTSNAYLYYDYLKHKYTLLESYSSITEEINNKITFIKYHNLRLSPNYLIVNNSTHSVFFDNVTSIKKHIIDNDSIIEITLKDGKKGLIKTDGTTIVPPGSEFEIKSKYIIISKKYNKCHNTNRYGILNMNGDTLVPPIMAKEDIVIKNNSYLIFSNRNQDDWCITTAEYVIAYNDDKENLYKAIKEGYDFQCSDLETLIAQKEWDTITTIPLPLEDQLKSNVRYSIPNTNTESDYLYKEELFNNIMYTNVVLKYFYSDYKGNYTQYRGNTHLYTKSDNDPYNAHIVARKHEQGEVYLIIKNSEFKISDLIKFSGNLDIKITYIAYLSNGKAILRTYSPEDKGMFIIDINNQKIEKYISLYREKIINFNDVKDVFYNLYVGDNGFYFFNSDISLLIKFDNNGEVIWKFSGLKGDHFIDFDENEKYVIITGYNTVEKYYQRENPMMVILDKKTGNIIERNVEDYIINEEVNNFWTNATWRDDKYILQKRKKENSKKYITKIVKFQ